jgi:hypothetical protein
MVPIDPQALSDSELDTLIDNHRRHDKVLAELYLNALAERARRRGKGLSFEKSFELIRTAAKEGRYLSYKELADASGAVWMQVRYSIGQHLWDLVEYADRRGWPMLSAIVVNKPNVVTGEMEPETLRGFVGAARLLGHSVSDEAQFLREQQKQVFAWAQAARDVQPDVD